jgi:predicted amidohydrolase YtcJ
MSRIFFYNADILTMDAARPLASTMLIENGRITAVGGNHAVLPGARSAECINMQGRTILPGFIDGHSHLVSNSYDLLFANACPSPKGECDDIPSLIVSLQKQFAAWHPTRRKNQWFMAAGMDSGVFPGATPPTKYDLDRISKEVPVAVIFSGGHAAVFNSMALALCGIGRKYRCPSGGFMPKLPVSDEYSGVLQENAFFAQASHIKTPGLSSMLTALKASLAEYASYGITTAQDARIMAGDLKMIRLAQWLNLFKFDVDLYFDPSIAGEMLPRRFPARNGYKRRVRPAGCRIFLDGNVQSKTAWLSEPYYRPPDNQPSDYCGYAALSDEEVIQHLEACFQNHWQVSVHTSGDEAAEQLIRCYETVKKRHPDEADLRPIAIHCQVLHPDQLDRMAALGMSVSFFCDHIYYWGDQHYDSTLGPARAPYLSPVKSALERGMHCTLHQDTPVVPPNVLLAVQNAVMRKTKSGRVLGQDECLTVSQALACVTCNGAWQLFQEDQKGSLEPGKLADLVVLDQNPLKVAPKDIGKIPILATLKEGRMIYEAK